jgi:hypothetical protein
MKKLIVGTAFAAAALASQSALACDWNREASTQNPVVATAASPTTAAQQAIQSTALQPTNAAPQENVRRSGDEAAPVVLITDRQ